MGNGTHWHMVCQEHQKRKNECADHLKTGCFSPKSPNNLLEIMGFFDWMGDHYGKAIASDCLGFHAN
jgi:hypothetical protein